MNISTGAVSLTPGQQYVLFLTTSSVMNPNSAANSWGSVNNAAYAGGQFVFNNNGSNFGTLSTSSWTSFAQDLAFSATFGAPTQPSAQSGSGTTQTSYDASNHFVNALFDFTTSQRTAPPGGSVTPYAPEDDEALAYAKKKTRAPADRDALRAVSRNNLFEPRWSIWGTAYGGTSTTRGNGGSADTTSRAFGFVAGVDYNVTPMTTIGFALGGGGTSYDVSQMGSGSAGLFQAGIFAKHVMGQAYVAGGVAYTFQDVTANRVVTLAGLDQLQSKFNANTVSGRVEGGYRFATPVTGVTPYGAIQVTNIDLPSRGEVAVVGANTFALNFASDSVTIVRTELGARFDRAFALQTAMLTLRGRLAWAHDEGNTRGVSAVMGSLAATAFTINGAVPAKDLALVSAGAEMKWLNNVSVLATFEGEFSNTTTGYGGKGTVRYVW